MFFYSHEKGGLERWVRTGSQNTEQQPREPLSSHCVQVWEGLCCLVKRNPHQLCLRCFTSFHPRMKPFGSPGQVVSLHIFLAPYYMILANRKRSNCSPSPIFLGKVLVSTSQWEDPSPVECECQALPYISGLWCSPLWHPENEKYGYSCKWNIVFFLRFPSQCLNNILSNGALLMIYNQGKKVKLYIPF